MADDPITTDITALAQVDTGFTDADIDDGVSDPINIRNLPTAKLGLGGQQIWTLKNCAEDTASEMYGVVVARREVRVMFAGKVGEGDPEVLCSSEDARAGDPRENAWARGITGDCGTCPMSRPFSADPGRWSPACNLRSHIYAMLPSFTAPMVFDLPPSSHSLVRDYFAGLKAQRIPSWAVYTHFRVAQRTARNGSITYSVVNLQRGEAIPPDYINQMRAASAHWRNLLIPPAQSVPKVPPHIAANRAAHGSPEYAMRDGNVIDANTGEIVATYSDEQAKQREETYAANDLPFEAE